MSNTQDIHEIELDIKVAEATVKRMETFFKLVDNADFKEIIEKGYFEDEAVRLVGALASPAMADETNQAELQKDMIGVGRLRQYFFAIVQKGRAAEGAINSNNTELEFMRAEELDA